MQLEWTGALKGSLTQRQTITAEFLEPYSSSNEDGACAAYSTCLACSTDVACGWCERDDVGVCIDRSSSAVDKCFTDTGSLVLISAHCPICADHVDCTSCVMVCFLYQ